MQLEGFKGLSLGIQPRIQDLEEGGGLICREMCTIVEGDHARGGGSGAYAPQGNFELVQRCSDSAFPAF